MPRMVMQAYSKPTSASSFYWDGTSTSKTLFPISSRILGGIVSSKGDYKHPTGHAYSKTVWRGWTGRISVYAGGRLQSERTGAMPYTYSSTGGLVSSAYEQSALQSAISDAYEKLRGSIDLSVDLVQWRQVVSLVSAHRRLAAGLKTASRTLLPHVEKIEALQRKLKDPTIRRRRAKRMARELNNSLNYLAETRLEYVYGWSPTMRTIQDLAELAMNPKEPGMLRCEGKGRAKQTTAVYNTAIAGSALPAKHVFTISDRARVVLYYTPQKSVLDTMGKISSLNPAAILYEACPFSFVLDWMWDVGGWIRNLETAFLHRNDFVGGYQTLTKRVACDSLLSGTVYTYGPSSPGFFASYDLSGTHVMTRLSRTGLKTPPITVTPSRQFKFGIERQMNALALVKTVLLRADDLLSSRR